MPHSNAIKRLNINLFLSAIVIGTSVFFIALYLLLITQIDTSLNNREIKAKKLDAQLHANQILQYIKDQDRFLKNIVNNSFFTQKKILNKEDYTGIKEYIQQLSLFEKDTDFTLLNDKGDILYSSTEISPTTDKNLYKWALPTLKNTASSVIINVHNNMPDNESPTFEFAIAIPNELDKEIIFIAHTTPKAASIYKTSDALADDVSIDYSSNKKSISGQITQHQFKEKIHLYPYNLYFTYSDNRNLSLPGIKQTKNKIIVLLISAFIIALIFLLFCRNFFLKHYRTFEYMQQAVSSTVEGMCAVDRDNNYILANNAYCKMTGYCQKELIGKPLSITIHPEDREHIKNTFNEIDNDKTSIVVRGLKKNGGLFYQRITIVRQYDRNDNFTYHHCFAQDISAEKEHEEKVKQQQYELQLIFDNVPVKIWYKDDKNKILRLNKQAAESMGGTTEDFEGKDSYDLFPEMAKKYHDDDLAVIASNKPHLNIIEEYTPLNGPRRWVSTDKIPYTDPITKQSFIFVCAQDITDLKNAELKKAELVEKLSHTNRELEQFAYVASHDLKSPLRGINQLANWIRQDCEEIIPEDSKRHLELMGNRVLRMSTLLDDLLSYSRISQLDETQELIDLEQMLSHLLDLHVNPFSFKTQISVPKHSIVIARKPLEIVIRNLLDNAVKHHDKEAGTISVLYSETETDHIFDVVDDGPGIAPKLQERAFKVFQTLKPRDQVEGSGIGLAIIQKILLRYKGSVTIDSDGVRGTRFCIRWPKTEPTL